jgi:NADPH:quinone reductase-like Zn-dependent oxidoreductase
VPTVDGWWHTGDRVRQDADGWLYFQARADDVIVSAGYRIGPAEVESVLLGHPAVRESAVIGVPDAERGEVVAAVVVLRDGFVASDELAAELQAFAKAETAPYKYPRVVRFADALPKTTSGKIHRAALRAAHPPDPLVHVDQQRRTVEIGRSTPVDHGQVASVSRVSAVPEQALAAYIRSLGGPDVIEYGEVPTPRPGPGEVLVRTAALAVDHVDTFVRSGRYRTPTPFPFVVGRDLVGSVAALGPGAAGFAPGQPVWCNSLGHAGRQGSFAQYAAVPAERLYRLPAGVDPVAAVVLLHTAATAWLGLVRHARLRAGETVLVGGAGGGVGSAAVQLAAAAGARVIATGGPADADWARAAGAVLVLDYHDRDLYRNVAAAAPEGVDVYWDTSGHHDLVATLPLLARGGRVLITAGLAATTPLPVGPLYTADAALLGFAISNASVVDLAAAAAAINAGLASGVLRGRIAETLPLAETAHAHALVESGAHPPGRLVVLP